MEKNIAGTKKELPTAKLGPTAPPESLLPEAVDELPNESNLHLQSIHYSLVGQVKQKVDINVN